MKKKNLTILNTEKTNKNVKNILVKCAKWILFLGYIVFIYSILPYICAFVGQEHHVNLKTDMPSLIIFGVLCEFWLIGLIWSIYKVHWLFFRRKKKIEISYFDLINKN